MLNEPTMEKLYTMRLAAMAAAWQQSRRPPVSGRTGRELADLGVVPIPFTAGHDDGK